MSSNVLLPYLAIFEACELHMLACHVEKPQVAIHPFSQPIHLTSPKIGSFARHDPGLMQGALKVPRMSFIEASASFVEPSTFVENYIDSDDGVEVKSHWEELGGSAQVWGWDGNGGC